jgi:hypothetical protein
VLYGSSAVLCGGLVVVFLQPGWPDEADPTPAIALTILSTAGLVTFCVLALAARRLIGRSIKDVVAAGPDRPVPDTLRVGSARPWLYGAGIATFIVLAMAALVIFASPSSWLCPGLVLVTILVQFVRKGPAAALNLSCAYVDDTGIQFAELDIHVPWSSVSGIDVHRTGIRLQVDGPVTPLGRLPAGWARRVAEGLRDDPELTLWTDRQDVLAWTVQRHLGTRDTQSTATP